MASEKKVDQRSAQSLFLKMYAEALGLSADSISTALQDIMMRIMTYRDVAYAIIKTLDPDQQEAAWVLLGDYLPPRPVEPVDVEGLILDEAATDAFHVEELDVDDLNNYNQQEQDNTVNTPESIEEVETASGITQTAEDVNATTESVADPVEEVCEGKDPLPVALEVEPQAVDNDIPSQEVDVPAQDTDSAAVESAAPVVEPVVAQDTVTQDAPKKRGGPRGPRAPKIAVDDDAFEGDLVAFTLDGTRTPAKSLRTTIMSLFRKVVDENKLGEARASWFKQLDEAVTDERLYRKLDGTNYKIFLNLAVPDCKKRVQALLNILKGEITLHFSDGNSRTIKGINE